MFVCNLEVVFDVVNFYGISKYVGKFKRYLFWVFFMFYCYFKVVVKVNVNDFVCDVV